MVERRPITILNVEDNTVGRYALTQTLQEAGFLVKEATTGSETMRLAAENPDLIILDVKLPDISGFEVCRQLKANPDTAFIPVLHLSAKYVTSEDKVQGLDSGADAYLIQPVEPLELIATIKALLRLRQAEEIARNKAREWQTTFDAMNDGVCLLDREGKILRCNQAIADLLQTPFKEINGCSYHALIKEKLGSIEIFPFSRLQENRCRESVELPIGDRWFRITADPVLDSSGVVGSAVYIVADVTQRQQAQEALRQAQAEQLADMTRLHELSTHLSATLDLQTILQEVLVAVTALQNAQMGLVRLYDAQKKELYAVASIGLSDEYLDKTGRVPIGVGVCGLAIAQSHRIIIEDVQTDPIYAPYIQQAQLAGYRAAFSTPLFTRNGDILGTIAIYFREPHRPSDREIYRVEMYAQNAGWAIDNARLYQEAENVNRLKDEFLATLSHELRSPLNAILGWTQLLRFKTFDVATIEKALATIERNARLQIKLIEDLLDVSRIIRGQLNLEVRPVSIVSIIEGAIEGLRLAAEAKAIGIASEFDALSWVVLGDATRLQQIVWNLLSNAVKFTPSGGQVKIRLKRRASDVQIAVSDTGMGISPEFLPYVFDRFRQADSSTTRTYNGLGLGLAIVRHLVELHGGTVYAESAGVGQGATFVVELPLFEGRREKAESRRHKEENNILPIESKTSLLSGLRILLVDDETDAREVVAKMIQQYGAEVMAVTSAKEVLAAIAAGKSAWWPDVLVSDIGMPNEDGYDLIREVRAKEAERGTFIPAVALTAYAREEDRERSLAAGYQLHLSKPVNPDELATAIANLVSRNKIV